MRTQIELVEGMRAACLGLSVQRAWPGRAGTHTIVPSTRSCPNRAAGWSGGGGHSTEGIKAQGGVETRHQLVPGEAGANTFRLESWCP